MSYDNSAYHGQDERIVDNACKEVNMAIYVLALVGGEVSEHISKVKRLYRSKELSVEEKKDILRNLKLDLESEVAVQLSLTLNQK